jgi:hypothetical protein
MSLTFGRALAVILLGLCAMEASAKCHVSWVDDDKDATTPPMPQQVCNNDAMKLTAVAETVVPQTDMPVLPASAPLRSCAQVFDSSVGADATVCSARMEASVNWQ